VIDSCFSLYRGDSGVALIFRAAQNRLSRRGKFGREAAMRSGCDPTTKGVQMIKRMSTIDKHKTVGRMHLRSWLFVQKKLCRVVFLRTRVRKAGKASYPCSNAIEALGYGVNKYASAKGRQRSNSVRDSNEVDTASARRLTFGDPGTELLALGTDPDLKIEGIDTGVSIAWEEWVRSVRVGLVD
jgi:hypothetical protein